MLLMQPSEVLYELGEKQSSLLSNCHKGIGGFVYSYSDKDKLNFHVFHKGFLSHLILEALAHGTERKPAAVSGTVLSPE
jgi:hypothetical protein